MPLDLYYEQHNILLLQEESSEKKGADSGKGKRHDTPSLKLTFKRAPSGNYQDQSKKDSSTHL